MDKKNSDQHYNYEDIQKNLVLHIWKNNHLRTEMMKNPKEVIERELGIKFSKDLEINIVNHTDMNEVTFILPFAYSKFTKNELSDEQLENVSGGIDSGVKAFNYVLSSHLYD